MIFELKYQLVLGLKLLAFTVNIAHPLSCISSFLTHPVDIHSSMMLQDNIKSYPTAVLPKCSMPMVVIWGHMYRPSELQNNLFCPQWYIGVVQVLSCI